MADDLQALDRALARVVDALSGTTLQFCTQAAAAPVLAEAVRRAPVHSGELRNRLGTVSHHSGNTATTAVQVADSGPGGIAHEAIFVEFGTSRMAARPFMRPALAAAQTQALQQFSAALLAELNLQP